MLTNALLKRFIRRAYQGGHGELHLKSTQEVREHIQNLMCPHAHLCEFEDYQPEPNIDFRIYRAKKPKQTIWFVRASAYTGGGSLNDTNGICDTLRQKYNAHVVSLNFRAPPEYKFPTYFDDILATVRWIHEHIETLNLTEPMISWGESSGGALVASLNQYLTKHHQNFFDAQVLVYPLLDLVTQTPSRKAFGQGYMLDISMIHWLEKRVLNSLAERQDFRASPGLHTVKDQPPTIVITSEFDPLKDEGYQYAQRLKANGSQVSYYCAPQMIHGFLRYYNKLDAAENVFTWIDTELEALIQSDKSE